MLKKKVCKQCRIDSYDGGEGWNEFCEAWWIPNKLRPGHVVCPPNITMKMSGNIVEKIEGVLTEGELSFSTVRYALRIIKSMECPVVFVKEGPPWWCPFSILHKE